jgi:hypothetical protein
MRYDHEAGKQAAKEKHRDAKDREVDAQRALDVAVQNLHHHRFAFACARAMHLTE